MDMERKLRSLGQRDDIMKTMHRVMREAGIDRPAGSFAIFHGEESKAKVVGRIAVIGLTDEITDRHYVVVDGTDGRVYYADIGTQKPGALPGKGMIVSLDASHQEAGNRQQIRLRVLSYLNLEKLTLSEGATWLDKELIAKAPVHIAGQGFGADVKLAFKHRMQWLTEQGLSQASEDGSMCPAANLMNKLRRRELQHTAASISTKSGLSHANPIEGEQFSGTYKQAVNLASGKYAIIENAKEFVLVPWKPSFEDMRGKVVSSVVGLNRNWEFNIVPKRGLGI